MISDYAARCGLNIETLRDRVIRTVAQTQPNRYECQVMFERLQNEDGQIETVPITYSIEEKLRDYYRLMFTRRERA